MGYYLLIRPPKMALFDPAGGYLADLSKCLSTLFDTNTRRTARKYGHAVQRFLDAAQADPASLGGLFASTAAARQTLTRLLRDMGCRLRHCHLPGGGGLVTPPPKLVACIDTALCALSHGYEELKGDGVITFANPVMTEAIIVPPGQNPERYHVLRHFVLTNRRRSLPRRDDPHCSSVILAAATAWPPGIFAATLLTARLGNRIGEAFALNCRDWAAADFGKVIRCPNKGSRGARTKNLFLDPQLHQHLTDYVDGPRRDLTGLGLAELRRLARSQPDHPALDAPLLFNTQGRRIKYSLYNDYYFRPTIRPLLRGVTPHWLRHEHALEALLYIKDHARDEAHEEYLIFTFAELQGWESGPEMVHYYAPQVRDAEQRELADALATHLQKRIENPALPRAAVTIPLGAAPRRSPALAAILAAGEP